MAQLSEAARQQQQPRSDFQLSQDAMPELALPQLSEAGKQPELVPQQPRIDHTEPHQDEGLVVGQACDPAQPPSTVAEPAEPQHDHINAPASAAELQCLQSASQGSALDPGHAQHLSKATKAISVPPGAHQSAEADAGDPPCSAAQRTSQTSEDAAQPVAQHANAYNQLRRAHDAAHAAQTPSAVCCSSVVTAQMPQEPGSPGRKGHAERGVNHHEDASAAEPEAAEPSNPAQPVLTANPAVIWLSSDDESDDRRNVSHDGDDMDIMTVISDEKDPIVSGAEHGSNDVAVQQERQSGTCQTDVSSLPGQSTGLQSTPMTKRRSRKTTKSQMDGAASQHSIARPATASHNGTKRGPGSHATGPAAKCADDVDIVDLTQGW